MALLCQLHLHFALSSPQCPLLLRPRLHCKAAESCCLPTAETPATASLNTHHAVAHNFQVKPRVLLQAAHHPASRSVKQAALFRHCLAPVCASHICTSGMEPTCSEHTDKPSAVRALTLSTGSPAASWQPSTFPSEKHSRAGREGWGWVLPRHTGLSGGHGRHVCLQDTHTHTHSTAWVSALIPTSDCC